MSSSGSLDMFPREQIESLALLYVQSQDLTEISPEDLIRMYNDVFNKMKAEYRAILNGN